MTKAKKQYDSLSNPTHPASLSELKAKFSGNRHFLVFRDIDQYYNVSEYDLNSTDNRVMIRLEGYGKWFLTHVEDLVISDNSLIEDR